MNKITLWSLRNTVARGPRFTAERQVTKETAQEWLKVFRTDEPKVLFIASDRKPSLKKE